MAMKKQLFKNMNYVEDDIDWSQVDWVGEIQRYRYLHEVWKEKCMEQLVIELKKTSGKINIQEIQGTTFNEYKTIR